LKHHQPSLLLASEPSRVLALCSSLQFPPHFAKILFVQLGESLALLWKTDRIAFFDLMVGFDARDSDVDYLATPGD